MKASIRRRKQRASEGKRELQRHRVDWLIGQFDKLGLEPTDEELRLVASMCRHERRELVAVARERVVK